MIVDGERLDLIPPIIAMIAGSHFDARTLSAPADDAAPIYVPLADGRVLAMPAARLRPIIIATLKRVIDRASENACSLLAW